MGTRGSSGGRCNARRLVLWALVALFAPGPRAQAYPIAPVTLWSLTHKAESVVWADVEEVREAENRVERSAPPEGLPADWLDGVSPGFVARLRVREAWKGDAREGEQLEVHFPELVCPAPPRYVPGLAVVAFLVWNEGKWETVALSYGTRYPASNDDAEAYRRAVLLAKEAEDTFVRERATGQGVDIESARMDWQVRVAAHPATRWDGLHGWVPEADVSRGIYGLRKPEPSRLTGAQVNLLAQGFVERPPLDRTLPMMLMALRGHADKKVDEAAARALETVLSLGTPREWASLAFSLLRERHGERLPPRKAPTWEERLEREFRDAASGPSGPPVENEESLTRAWTRFKKRHQLKPTLLPLPVDPPVAGTGGDTPL